ncbi:ankyrin repeat protein [Chrysochromulina tobinii]|uniref:Ankyrin repeat protein n=1 Tax=Chrysochromulina tobinii TaxID=1460289 RepID=A0A0M0JM54_9EUKA|nr:ankyrin repeat protein [Chrysochromulina tobinii]|eukprot:KOO27656.1 ankyrin repeat protein [Chrysochromulina sp. CCMP291]
MPEADPGSLVYTAAYHGNVRHLKKLLQRHAKELDSLLKWPHPHGGATAIYVACEFGHTDAVKLLLEAKAPPDQPREDGATPLYKACQDGKLDIVKLLLKHGAKVDQIDANQMTALWVACHQGHIELAKVLLEAKADPTFKVQEWTPIMLAEREQRNELQQAAALQAMGMQQQNPEVTRTHRFYRAATANDEKSVRRMLESEEVVDINAAPGEGGATALYAVCIQGNCSMAQLLLDARASPNIALKNGETALLAATTASRLDVARLLLEHSADVNACTAHGKTALMVACHKGDGAMARLLLDEGASTGEVLKGKGTALISAASVGQVDCVRMLLDEGNDESLSVRFQNRSALEWALHGSSENHRMCVALLKSAVAEIEGDVEDKSAKKKEKYNGTPSEGPMGVTAAAPSASESAASSKAAADPGVDTPMPTPPTAPTRKGAGAASAPNVPTVAPADAPASAPVNLGPGRTGRIELHEGDDPRKLAADLAKAHGLDASVEAKFGGLIEAGSHSHGDSVGLRARKPAAAAVEEEDNPFRVKRPDAPAWQLKWWRKEHTQFLYVVLAAIFFAVAIVGFVYYDDWRRNQEEIVKAA